MLKVQQIKVPQVWHFFFERERERVLQRHFFFPVIAFLFIIIIINNNIMVFFGAFIVIFTTSSLHFISPPEFLKLKIRHGTDLITRIKVGLIPDKNGGSKILEGGKIIFHSFM